MKRILIGIILVTLFLMSCATSQFGWAPDPSAEGNVQDKMNEDFDFVELDDDDPEVEPNESQVKTTDRYVAPSVAIKTPIQNSEQDESAMILGHRVQLMSFDNEGNAREAKKNALFKFQHPVYLEFDSGRWKLRIGDCKTVDEAQLLIEEAARKGYRDAFRVKTKVYQTSE